MQSFLCRVMALVFVLNCMLPAPGAWAQPRVSSDQIRQLVNQFVPEQLEEQLESSVAAASEELQYAQTPAEIATAISKLHSAVEVRAAFNKQEEAKQKLRESLVAPRSSTYVAPPKWLSFHVARPKENEVLEKLKKNELTIDEMLNYIDPFDPEKYDIQNIIYASEVLGNSVDSFLAFPDYLFLEELNSLVLFAQLRVLYRLEKLSKKAPASIYDAMALGSLRITLWKLHNFYVQTGQKDPLLAPEIGNPLSNSSFPAPQFNDELPWIATNSWAQREISFQLPPDIYQQINRQFLSELKALKAKNPEETSTEYQMLLTLADYATVYAILQNPSYVRKIVKVFDEGAKRSLISDKVVPGKFLQQYSSLLNAIFTSVYESVKYLSSDSAVWNQIVEMAVEFSDPEKYSLPTRIFALEMASLLYRNNQSCPVASGANVPPYPVFIRCNTGDTRDAARRSLFARRTADLYAPLTRTHYLGMKDYGLDSQQMQMLADKLAFIYNGFANDDLKWDYSRPHMKGSYVLDKGEDGKSLILNGENSIPRLVPIEHGQQFRLPDGSLKTISGFARTSDGTWVEMQLKNGLNAKKASDEATAKFFWFVGNAIFWIYGGEIFSFIGTAYRTTKGAMIALPKAVKAASQANKGRRMMRFGIEIQKGVRYANLSKTLNNNAVTLVAERTIEKPLTRAERKMPVTQSYTPKLEYKYQAVTSQHALRGEYSKWNPKRWFGMKPPEITRFSFYQPTPGFGGIRQGSSYVGNTSLSRGIRNWDDWRKLRSSFRSPEVPIPNTSTEALSTFTKGFRSPSDPKIMAFPQFYDYATRKQLFQELRLTQAVTDAAKNGAFNAWVPIKTPVYSGASSKATGETVTWWNVNRLGLVGNEMAEGTTSILLTPAISKKAAQSMLIDPTKLDNAIEIPLQQVFTNSWQPTVIGHYFNKVQRSGLGKYLLPDYVPNANFWKATTSNWRFAVPTLKHTASNTRFWQGFVGNTLFFGAWAGLDMATYPFMESFMVSSAEEDREKFLAEFGDTFSQEELDKDAAAVKAANEAAGLNEEQLQTPSISAYEAVTSAQKKSSEGALLTFPIIAFRRILPEGLGHLSFVSDQERAMVNQMYIRLQVARATREQKRQAALDQMLEQIQYDQVIMEEYCYYLGGEAAQKDMQEIYRQYEGRVRAAMATQEPLEEQLKKISSIQDDVSRQVQQKYDELIYSYEMSQEKAAQQLQQQAQQVEEEEYIPDYGQYFEETPVEGY